MTCQVTKIFGPKFWQTGLGKQNIANLLLPSLQLTTTVVMYPSAAATNHDETEVLDGSEAPDEASLLPPQHSLVPTGGVVNVISRRLFISHFLSTWNSRFFEFGAVLFLVTIFPDSLMPPSVYALARAAAAIFLAPSVGRYVDSGDRIHVVRVSISTLFIVSSISWIESCFSGNHGG
jgi:hypothetical protein